MQLIFKLILSVIICLSSILTFSQNELSINENAESRDKATAQFLISYYEQDGEHSPVTGGIGTEKLDDITPRLVVNIPLKHKQNINVLAGIDIYTSASTDMIDFQMSSASKQDSRTYGTITYTKEHTENRMKVGGLIGASNEYDYISFSGGVLFSKWSKNKNRQLDLKASAFIDQWKTYYPEDLPQQFQVADKARNTINFTSLLTQVINKNLQVSLSADAVYQQGLLSTPFHRVFFENEVFPRLEKLPDTRLKIPVGVKANYYINDYFVLRLGYRYYWDDWNLTAHTIETELPIKFGRFFTIYPFYRYHTQTAAEYFEPSTSHATDAQFFTNDYDLSELTSDKFGLGIRWSPLNGVGRIKRGKNKVMLVKEINFRYAKFDRSDGLKANIFSLGIGFEF